MTEAEAVWLLMRAFPGVKVEACASGTQDAVMKLAIRRQNASGGAERTGSGGAEAPSACRPSALKSDHGAQADGSEAKHQVDEAQSDGTLDLFAQAV